MLGAVDDLLTCYTKEMKVDYTLCINAVRSLRRRPNKHLKNLWAQELRQSLFSTVFHKTACLNISESH